MTQKSKDIGRFTVKMESSILVLQLPSTPIQKAATYHLYIFPEIFCARACMFSIWFPFFLPFRHGTYSALPNMSQRAFLSSTNRAALFILTVEKLVLSVETKDRTTWVQIPIPSLPISETLDKSLSLSILQVPHRGVIIIHQFRV